MAYIKAHTFTTELEYLEAIDRINKGEGIPVSEDATTRTYTDFQVQEGVYYIHAEKVTEKYFGKGEDFEIIEDYITT